MKLILAIINHDDANTVTQALTKKGFSSTKLATTGGFLMAGNVTIMVGVDEEKVQTVIDIIREHSHSRKQMIPTTTEMSYGYYPSMPVEVVVGGATISVFATITMTGIRMITEGGFTPRKSSVVGLSVALGVGITQVSGCLAGEGFPAWVNTVFGSSSVVVAALMAILLNLILPKEPSANG